MRISRESLMMQTAELWSQRSTCLRLQVGAVIAFNDRPIASGYNGAPSGMEHCNGYNCSSLERCERTIHAEMNAILFAAKHGIPTDGTTLYTTHQPCLDCAKAIVNAGIITVYYKFPYRLTNGLQLLEDAGIEVIPYGG